MNSYSTLIALKRKQLGKSQADLAEAMHYSVQAVAKYEKGQSDISVQSLLVICRFLDIDPDSFLAGKDQNNHTCDLNKEFDGKLFASNLRNARLKARLSLDKLAEDLKISSRSLKNYEGGHSVPFLSVFSEILKYTNQTASVFLTQEIKGPTVIVKTKMPLSKLILAIGLIVFVAGGATYGIVTGIRYLNKRGTESNSLGLVSSDSSETSFVSSSLSSGVSSLVGSSSEISSSASSANSSVVSSSEQTVSSAISSGNTSNSASAVSSENTRSSSIEVSSSSSEQTVSSVSSSENPVSSSVSSSISSSALEPDVSFDTDTSTFTTGTSHGYKTVNYSQSDPSYVQVAYKVESTNSALNNGYFQAIFDGVYVPYAAPSDTKYYICIYDFSGSGKEITTPKVYTVSPSPAPNDLSMAINELTTMRDLAQSDAMNYSDSVVAPESDAFNSFLETGKSKGYVDSSGNLTASASETFKADYISKKTQLDYDNRYYNFKSERSSLYSMDVDYLNSLY
ncbi:MAG: helix-turn-helix domain-containing protein [Bacilli bacterium]|jgi:transcriptional regulator with XRE-family HTH domain|nr:helix-turn-helix domain-containing protein [Bacilli bacterium]